MHFQRLRHKSWAVPEGGALDDEEWGPGVLFLPLQDIKPVSQRPLSCPELKRPQREGRAVNGRLQSLRADKVVAVMPTEDAGPRLQTFWAVPNGRRGFSWHLPGG